MTIVSDNSPRAPLGRSQLAREDLLRHTTIFLNSTGTNATATLAMLQQENQFFLLTAEHVARMIEEKRKKWSYQNPERVLKYLNHPPIRTDLGNEGLYSQDLTLLELHAEDAAEMVRLGLSFYDLRTSQYSSDEEYGPDYFIIGAPKSAEVLANSDSHAEFREMDDADSAFPLLRQPGGSLWVHFIKKWTSTEFPAAAFIRTWAN